MVIPFFWLLSQLVIPHAAVRSWRIPRLGAAHKVTAILWAQDTAPASDCLQLTHHPNHSSSWDFSFARGLCLSLCYLKHLPKTWYKNILLSLKSSGQLSSNIRPRQVWRINSTAYNDQGMISLSQKYTFHSPRWTFLPGKCKLLRSMCSSLLCSSCRTEARNWFQQELKNSILKKKETDTLFCFKVLHAGGRSTQNTESMSFSPNMGQVEIHKNFYSLPPNCPDLARRQSEESAPCPLLPQQGAGRGTHQWCRRQSVTQT